MEQELVLWFWRGLLTLGMGGVIRLLLWQRKIERELTEIKVKMQSSAEISKKVEHIREDVTTLKANIGALGSIKSEISACHLRLDDVAKTTAEQTGELRQMKKALELIQQLLMGRGTNK